MSKARLIEFDAETFRTFNEGVAEELRRGAMERRPAQTTAKDVKTEWDTSEARAARAAEALGKTSVDVLLAEPLCVCWASYEEATGPGDFDFVDMMNTEEPLAEQRAGLEVLAERWNALAGPDTIWAGHNIEHFDLAVLYNAWIRNGVTPPDHFPQYAGRYWKGRVFDTMKRIPSGGIGLVSLDNACAALGVAPPEITWWSGEPVDGSKVAQLYEAGEHQVVLTYCMRDIPPVHGLYLKLTSGDTRGTYDRSGAVGSQVEEIRASADLTESQKLVAVLSVLEMAGVIRKS